MILIDFMRQLLDNFLSFALGKERDALSLAKDSEITLSDDDPSLRTIQ